MKKSSLLVAGSAGLLFVASFAFRKSGGEYPAPPESAKPGPSPARAAMPTSIADGSSSTRKPAAHALAADPPLAPPLSRHPKARERRGEPGPQAEWTAELLDASRPFDERLRALGRLEGLGSLDRDGAQGALSLLRAASDPGIRERLCRTLAKIGFPEVRAELIARARSDGSDQVRETVVRILAPNAADIEVKSALERIAVEDPVKAVRNEAMKALAGR